MRFITFQPMEAYNCLKRGKEYKSVPKFQNSFNKIFALKLNEKTKMRLFNLAASMPQVCIVFESDNFIEIDYINYMNKIAYSFLGGEIKHKEIDSKYKDYIFDYINPKDVIDMIIISKSTNEYIVQDDFINTKSLKFIEELSGTKWLSINDALKTNFKRTVPKLKLMTACMMLRLRGTL